MVSFLGKFAAWLLSDPVAEKRAAQLLEQREEKFREEMRNLIAEGLEKQQPIRAIARRVAEEEAKRTLPPAPTVGDYERQKQEMSEFKETYKDPKEFFAARNERDRIHGIGQKEDAVTIATTPQGMDVLTTMLVVNALVDSSPASVPDCSSSYSDYSSSCGDSSCSSSDFGSCDSSGSF
jgi:hypothetical protein